MLPKTSTGIEIVGGTLRVAVVRSFLNRRRLLDSFEIPGFGSLSPAEQKQRLSDLKKKQHISGSRVHLVLPHDRGIVRQIELPVEVQGKLSDVVTYQLEAVSPWPIDEVYWAYAKTSPVKGSKVVTVTIVVVPRDVVDDYVALFRLAGLPLGGVTISAGAWAEGAASLWGGSSPVAVLGCEDDHVECVLMAGNRFFSAVESGAETVSQASSVLDLVLARGRVSDPETVRLVAHGSQVDRLPEEPSPRLPLENATAGATRKFGAIAGAIAGLGNTGFAANVLPLELRHRASQVRMVPTYALILLIVLAALGSTLREPYQSGLYASEIEQEIDRIAPTVTEVADREARLLDAEARFQALAGHVRGQDQNLEILRTLATSLPGTDWLLDYTYEAGTITLSGNAADTSQLQGLLESSSLFQDVQFSGPVATSPSGNSQFTLEMTEEARQ